MISNDNDYCSPENNAFSQCWYDIGHSQRLWPNIVPALAQRRCWVKVFIVVYIIVYQQKDAHVYSRSLTYNWTVSLDVIAACLVEPMLF